MTFKKHKNKFIIVLVCCVFIASAHIRADDEVDQLHDLWDYNDPAATELLFISLTGEAKQSSNAEYLPILITQLARTHSLRNEFQLAQEQLDQAKSLIVDKESRPWVYLLLERGRVYNSSGSKAEAVGYFMEAFRIAEIIGQDHLAVDAAHMVAIAETLEKQMKWNIIALGIAEASDSPRARKWLGTLYNNMAWTLFDQGEYKEALGLFKKAVDFRREEKNERRLHIARWAVARTYRALQKIDEALEIQQSLLIETEKKSMPADGYVLEELAELYLLKQDAAAADYFSRAHRALSRDEWLVKNEPERLARLKKLAVRN